MQTCYATSKTPSKEPDPLPANAEDSQRKKKRHRGKRGGRKCKKTITATQEAKA
jgi:hypothetical protein